MPGFVASVSLHSREMATGAASACSTGRWRSSRGSGSGRGDESCCLHRQPALQVSQPRFPSEPPGWPSGAVAWQQLAAAAGGWAGWGVVQQQQQGPAPGSLRSATPQESARGTVQAAQEHAAAGNPWRGNNAANSQTVALRVVWGRYTINLLLIPGDAGRSKDGHAPYRRSRAAT